MPSTSTPTISGGGAWPEKPAKPDTEADEQKTSETQTAAFSDNNTRTYYSPDGKLIIKVPQGTKLISSRNEELSYISITLSRYTLLIPQNNTLISPIYDVTTFTAEGQYEYPELDTPVTIVIEFDKDKLPERFISIYVARYTEDSRWVKLTDVLEINHEAGTLTVVTTQLSNIAVFAETDMANDFIEVIPSLTDDNLKPTLPDSKDSRIKIDLRNISSTKSAPAREILSQISLIVAISGTLTMIVLAYLERKRRDSRHIAKG